MLNESSPAGSPLRQHMVPSYHFRIFVSLLIFIIFLMAPMFLFQAPLPSRTLYLLLLCAVLSIFSTITGPHALTFFNSVAFFLLVYPFFIQRMFSFKFIKGGDLDLAEKTFVYFSAFVILVNLFCMVAPSGRVAKSDDAAIVGSRSPAIGAVMGTMVGLVIGFAIIVIFGPDYIFLPRQRGVLYGVQPLGSFSRFFIGIFRTIPYWIVYFYLLSPNRLSRRSAWLGAIPIVAIAFAISNPYNSERFLSLLGVLIIFFAFVRKGQMMFFWNNSPVLVATGLMILPWTSVMRSGVSGALDFSAKAFMDMFFSYEFSALAILNDFFTISYNSLSGSVRLLSAVLIFIPRSIWHDKNQGTGSSIAAEAHYGWHNIGVPPIADAYLDFGAIGVVLLALCAGLAIRKSSNVLTPFSFTENRTSTGAKLSFIGLIPIFMRGDLSTFFIAFYSSVAAFAIARFFCTFSVRRN